MKIVALTVYFGAAVSCALAAETSKIPKWISPVNRNGTASIMDRNLESRSTCDIQRFTSCLLTFFGHIGLSNTTLPNDEDFHIKFYATYNLNPPQGFKELCSYMNELSKCAPSSDCWTLDSMNQLGFPADYTEVNAVLYDLLLVQYTCTVAYQTAVSNWACFIQARMDAYNCTVDYYHSCAEAKAYLSCVRNSVSNQCNSDVGKMYCQVNVVYWNGINSLPCNSSNFDNACSSGGSGGSIAGSRNDRFYSIVLAFITALAITSLKHT